MLGYLFLLQRAKIASSFADFVDRNSGYRERNRFLVQRIEELEDLIPKYRVDSDFVNQQSASSHLQLGEAYRRIGELERTLNGERAILKPVQEKLALTIEERDEALADYNAVLRVNKTQGEEINDLNTRIAELTEGAKHHGFHSLISNYISKKRAERRAREKSE